MYVFQASIHALPSKAVSGKVVALGRGKFRTLKVDAASIPSLPVTFEDAALALSAIDRLYFEPDGSFVWVSDNPDQSWQLDGVLYDRAGQLLYAEVQGTCPADIFDRLLTALGWPAIRLMFQLRLEAVFLDEPEFRRYASARQTHLP